MFFSHRMLRRSALLTPILALGLAASPVHSEPSDMLSDPSTVLSRNARADTNGTFEATINGVQYVSHTAHAKATLLVGAPYPKSHYFDAGSLISGAVVDTMGFELRFNDTEEQAVDGAYYFDLYKTDLMLFYGEFDGHAVYPYFPNGGYVELRFSPDRTWVEGKFAFTAYRSDGAKRMEVDGTFSMPNTDVSL